MPGTQRHLPWCFLDISPQGASPEAPPCPYLAWHWTWSTAGRRQRGSGRCWAGVCPCWSLSSVPLYPRTYVGAGLHGHMYTHTHTHTCRHTQSQVHTDKHTHTQTHRETHRHADTHTYIQRHIQTHRHRQTDRHTHTHTQPDKRQHTEPCTLRGQRGLSSKVSLHTYPGEGSPDSRILPFPPSPPSSCVGNSRVQSRAVG